MSSSNNFRFVHTFVHAFPKMTLFSPSRVVGDPNLCVAISLTLCTLFKSHCVQKVSQSLMCVRKSVCTLFLTVYENQQKNHPLCTLFEQDYNRQLTREKVLCTDLHTKLCTKNQDFYQPIIYML